MAIAEEPRIEEKGTFQIAGLSHVYPDRDVSGIPAQWQRFAPYLGKIAGQAGWLSYGVCYPMSADGSMDYVCAVEVTGAPALPPELQLREIDAQTYAVFSHRDHISKISHTWMSIFNQWLPASEWTMVRAPQFELYGPAFDPSTGTGLVEIWIPVKRK